MKNTKPMTLDDTNIRYDKWYLNTPSLPFLIDVPKERMKFKLVTDGYHRNSMKATQTAGLIDDICGYTYYAWPHQETPGIEFDDWRRMIYEMILCGQGSNAGWSQIFRDIPNLPTVHSGKYDILMMTCTNPGWHINNIFTCEPENVKSVHTTGAWHPLLHENFWTMGHSPSLTKKQEGGLHNILCHNNVGLRNLHFDKELWVKSYHSETYTGGIQPGWWEVSNIMGSYGNGDETIDYFPFVNPKMFLFSDKEETIDDLCMFATQQTFIAGSQSRIQEVEELMSDRPELKEGEEFHFNLRHQLTYQDKRWDEDFSWEVQTGTVDKYVKDNDLNIGLMHIEFQGWESRIIKGAQEVLKKHRPYIQMRTSLSSNIWGDPTLREMYETLFDNNYMLVTCDGRRYSNHVEYVLSMVPAHSVTWNFIPIEFLDIFFKFRDSIPINLY